MAARIDQTKRNQMFRAWCEKQSEQYVSNMCAISRASVTKYHRVDEWDKRLADAQAKLHERLSDKIAAEKAKMLKAIQFTTGKVFARIRDGEHKSGNDIQDFIGLCRLQLVLMGEPESRVAHGEFEHLTDEQVLALYNQLNGDNEADKAMTELIGRPMPSE